MLKVVCWKWDGGLHKKKGIRFDHHHVNKLYSMVARNLRMQHEFICITDDPRGILPNVKIIPLWDDYRELGGCYVRLRAFGEEMKRLIGDRFVWIDLDTVIVDDITPLFNVHNDFKIWGDTHPYTPYNGSMCLMDAGARKQVWDDFDPPASIKYAESLGYVGTDQAWIGACLGKGEAKWSEKDGVYSFNIHMRHQNLIDPPDNARVIFFHGCADPSQPEMQAKYKWIKEHWQ